MATVARPIFLLTDFGLHDPYVGHVKGVIASLAPGSAIHDLTHDVSSFAVEEGAWLLETSLDVLPADAVVMAVVDPGVGTSRRALVAQSGGRTFVGPDNGVLSALAGARRPASTSGTRLIPARAAIAGLDGLEVRDLCQPSLMRKTVSSTFHARDVFAPAAAHIAAGADFRRAGPPLSEMLLYPPFCGVPAGFGALEACVVHIDRYGNLITTVRANQLFPRFALEVSGHSVDMRVRTFAQAPPATAFCHIDSSGYLAVGANQESAARLLGATRGTPVRVLAR